MVRKRMYCADMHKSPMFNSSLYNGSSPWILFHHLHAVSDCSCGSMKPFSLPPLGGTVVQSEKLKSPAIGHCTLPSTQNSLWLQTC